MTPFELAIDKQDGIPVAVARGYYDKEAGRKVLEEIGKLLLARQVFLVLDVSGCKVINSPGVASIVDLAIKVADDFQGRLFIAGLDPLKMKVFKVVGVFPLAEAVSSVEEGVRKAVALSA